MLDGSGSESAHVDGEGVGDGKAVGDACGGGVFRLRSDSVLG